METEAGAEALEWFAQGNGAIVARAGVLDNVVRSTRHEPEAVAIRAHSEQLRRDGYRRIVDHLHSTFGCEKASAPRPEPT